MTSTSRDRKVLDMVFDPEGSLGPGELSFGPDQEPSAQDKEAIQLEIRAIQAAEGGDTDQALQLLDQAVSTSPSWASTYNNRAQLGRMTKKPAPEIIRDLNKAIKLATPSSEVPLTRRNAKTLAQAYTQRSAVLFTLLDPSLPAEQLEAQVDQLRQLGGLFEGTKLAQQASSEQQPPEGEFGSFSVETAKLTIEELASRDLSLGARYGNSVAKQVAVQTNPYAKLCGKIVREALVSEYSNRS
ncbi:uncharacterized protein PFL1_00112 [Pseudozyma flocculosa PF-1]|uniref:Tetratricopeptide repeat protein 36 n=1 Tax=Pseudozyma flocculosa TaxID=84751 RepID=A0A5C3EU26_9BASI|nr:uncharacterized protein PFL1_00112 [Pseudozyma flocculosa PF-1]EPQ31913.1 hypothetical protein PFL1_00112 [Pseudozyma flocculosa PF-1]SPO35175.1 uncharacterized protein PSFLO_00646 [Pseudozyma flocculosa]